MNTSAPKKSFAKVAALCFVQFSFYAMSGALAYNSAFMDGKGMTPQAVGLITALSAAFGVVGQLFWGVVADKINSSKRTLILCILCAAGVGLLVPAMSELSLGSIPPSALAIALISFFSAAATPLIDNWLLGIMKEDESIQFGRVRMFGSIGGALMGFFVAWLVQTTGSYLSSYYLYAAMAIPTVSVCLFMKEGARIKQKKTSLKDMQLGRLFTDYYYRWFIIFCVGAFLTMTSGTYGYLLLKEVAGTEAFVRMGEFSSYACIIEIISLMISPGIVKKVGMERSMIIVSLLYVPLIFFNSICTTLTMYIISVCVGGALYGFVLATFIPYTDVLAPRGLETSAQAARGAVFSLTSVFTGFVGGSIIELIGLRGYYRLYGIITLASVLWFIYILKRGKAKGIPKQGLL